MEKRNVCPGRTAISMRCRFRNSVWQHKSLSSLEEYEKHLTKIQFQRFKVEMEKEN